MLSLDITPATVIIGVVIIALVVFALRRLRKRGMCDCKDCNEKGSCSRCDAVDKMIADMEDAANREDAAKRKVTANREDSVKKQ